MDWTTTWTIIGVLGSIIIPAIFIFQKSMSDMRKQMSSGFESMQKQIIDMQKYMISNSENVQKQMSSGFENVQKQIIDIQKQMIDMQKHMNSRIDNLSNGIRSEIKENRDSIKKLIETTSEMAGYVMGSRASEFKQSQRVPVGVSEKSNKYDK